MNKYINFLLGATLLISCNKESASLETQTVYVSEAKLTGITFWEDFESSSKTAYASGAATTESGSWYFDDAVVGASSVDAKIGKQSARIVNTGSLIMLFDKNNGADTVFVKHAIYGSDSAASWELKMSVNGGSSWAKVGNTVRDTSHNLSTQAFIVKQSGTVRFEILKVSGGSNRINIDDIAINDYTASSTPTTPTPTTPATNPTPTTSNINLLLGNPSNATASIVNANNYLMEKSQYTSSYSNSTLTPNWVSWHLCSSDMGSAARQDDYRADTSLPSGWYEVSTDYSSSGFDRGHMCPSADRTATVTDNSATFLMTNMIPQAPKNNQVTWDDLENYCRTLVKSGNELYIISGPYGKGGTGSKGYAESIGNGVQVPAKTWKIIVVLSNGDDDLSRITTSTRVISVLMPNDQDCSSHPWTYYRVSVDSLETLTGYDFLSNVPVEIQKIIEANVDNHAI